MLAVYLPESGTFFYWWEVHQFQPHQGSHIQSDIFSLFCFGSLPPGVRNNLFSVMLCSSDDIRGAISKVTNCVSIHLGSLPPETRTVCFFCFFRGAISIFFYIYIYSILQIGSLPPGSSTIFVKDFFPCLLNSKLSIFQSRK
jgi:hypothetical protein